jgi:hypothetical protein
MASIRTARVLAAVASLPLAAALFSGTAVADNGSLSDSGSNAAVTAVGSGSSNQSNTAQVSGSAFTVVDQSNDSVTVNFTPLW